MTRQVTGGGLNMRAAPSKSGRLITRIPDGSLVTVDEYGPSWCRVEWNGRTGYVMTEYLDAPASAPAGHPANTDGQTAGQLLDTALAALEQLKTMIAEG